jgi:hypothetical protein
MDVTFGLSPWGTNIDEGIRHQGAGPSGRAVRGVGLDSLDVESVGSNPA